jgi:2-hydroxychromene-2-carboxylate isomerase
MSAQIDFWFSIGSTYSYLTVMRIEDVARQNSVMFRWRPFDVVAIMTGAASGPARAFMVSHSTLSDSVPFPRESNRASRS